MFSFYHFHYLCINFYHFFFTFSEVQGLVIICWLSEKYVSVVSPFSVISVLVQL